MSEGLHYPDEREQRIMDGMTEGLHYPDEREQRIMDRMVEAFAIADGCPLDAAWAEAALAERGPLWVIASLRRDYDEWWVEIAYPITEPDGQPQQAWWDGPRATSPAAALRALAAKLREQQP